MRHAPTNFFAVATIALAANSYSRAIHRQAIRERWPRRINGNQFLFRPPAKLAAKCRRLARHFTPRGIGKDSIPPAVLAEGLRTTHRFLAVVMLVNELRAGVPREQALQDVCKAASFTVSTRSLRLWFARFSTDGLASLAERKRGRSGKRGKAINGA